MRFRYRPQWQADESLLRLLPCLPPKFFPVRKIPTSIVTKRKQIRLRAKRALPPPHPTPRAIHDLFLFLFWPQTVTIAATTMASTQHILLSPAELAYLHTSLSLTPPLRPDGRAATQFRPLSAETDILPGTNGSARICFADGTEAIVGVKAEVDKTRTRYGAGNTLRETELMETATTTAVGGDDDEDGEGRRGFRGESGWVEIAVEIPGTRDDEASTVYLAEMLAEALLADGDFVKRLWINRRFHWKLYLDVCATLFWNDPFHSNKRHGD